MVISTCTRIMHTGHLFGVYDCSYRSVAGSAPLVSVKHPFSVRYRFDHPRLGSRRTGAGARSRALGAISELGRALGRLLAFAVVGAGPNRHIERCEGWCGCVSVVGR